MFDREERQDLLVQEVYGGGSEDYGSDEESRRENEDAGPELSPRRELIEIIALAVGLAVSSAAAVVLLPLYLDTVATSGDAYTALVFTTVGAGVVLCLLSWACSGLYVRSVAPPRHLRTLRDGSLLAVSGFLSLCALQLGRVPCHAQDPLKGLVMVAAIVHYFFFSHRAVCLRTLFLSAGCVVGLFVACDYALCDGYRCRGWERDGAPFPDARLGRWGRVAWLTAYVVGLAGWTLVAGALSEDGGADTTVAGALAHAGRLHAFAIPTVALLAVAELVPGVAGQSELSVQWSALVGHVSPGPLAAVSWSWLAVYCLATSCSVLLLRRLHCSSLLSLGAACVGLPLAGLFWGFFRARPDRGPPLGFGLVEWRPKLATGETVSALLGLPLVLAALVLAFRTHLTSRGVTSAVRLCRTQSSP